MSRTWALWCKLFGHKYTIDNPILLGRFEVRCERCLAVESLVERFRMAKPQEVEVAGGEHHDDGLTFEEWKKAVEQAPMEGPLGKFTSNGFPLSGDVELAAAVARLPRLAEIEKKVDEAEKAGRTDVPFVAGKADDPHPWEVSGARLKAALESEPEHTHNWYLIGVDPGGFSDTPPGNIPRVACECGATEEAAKVERYLQRQYDDSAVVPT